MQEKAPLSVSGRGNRLRIRSATLDDAPGISILCEQLGYPVSPEEARNRLRRVRHNPQHAVYVAQGREEQVLGWVHVFVTQRLLAARQAEIAGLVVNSGQRRAGTGRLLMQQAEQWARAQGCEAVCLRSNVIRREAHTFYERLGYEKIKTQHAFRKLL